MTLTAKTLREQIQREQERLNRIVEQLNDAVERYRKRPIIKVMKK